MKIQVFIQIIKHITFHYKCHSYKLIPDIFHAILAKASPCNVQMQPRCY
ncbi:hypothetical protein HanXRQr2_Chr10g0428051 [Helianthus annuus]|uniref:Uncharacterized protein n=1 Tax=Helianthus annuus TaxID=4232 RepID=A0A9K3HWE1_HELAN|nr:hypothetical protein HanXRQr2_Chr10g0428051 [Helianthus annuus]